MIGEAQITVRNAGLLMAQRGLFVAGSFLFAVFVPRLMGPENYGRFALVTSLSIWFVMFSNLGLSQVIGRYVPEFKLQGDKEGLKKFFSNLLAVSLGSGTVAASLYLLLTLLWLNDLDVILLITIASTVFIQAWAHPFFSLFLGLNQAARWGMDEIFRRWFSIIFLLLGFYLDGLRGACLGLLLSELIVLSIGIWWGKSYLSWSELKLDLGYLIPYLQFGLIFFVSNLLYIAFQHSGEVLVRIFYGNYIEVGYFGLAYNVYLTIAATMPRFVSAFTPLMITLLAKGKTEELGQWIEQLLKWLSVGGILVVFAVLFLGNDLVPLVLGVAYRPVAINFMVLSITMLFQALSSVGHLLTLIYERPKLALTASIIRFGAFWGFGIPFVSWWGSLGGCLAVLAASAIFSGYFTWRMEKVMSYSLRRWALVIGLGGLFLPLAWLRSSWPVNIALYCLFLIGYGCALLFFRIMTRNEIAVLWQVIRSKNLVIKPTIQEE